MLKELADACDQLEVSVDRMAQRGVESTIVEQELGEESGQAREEEDIMNLVWPRMRDLDIPVSPVLSSPVGLDTQGLCGPEQRLPYPFGRHPQIRPLCS
jgi:hypothetical protein